EPDLVTIARTDPERPAFPGDGPEDEDEEHGSRDGEREEALGKEGEVVHAATIPPFAILDRVKRIGIDYGTKRVGVAVSDASGAVAFPKMTLANDRMLMSSLKELVAAEGIEEIVLGESMGPKGDNSVMAHIRRFARELERETGCAVVYEPEFYTS